MCGLLATSAYWNDTVVLTMPMSTADLPSQYLVQALLVNDVHSIVEGHYLIMPI